MRSRGGNGGTLQPGQGFASGALLVSFRFRYAARGVSLCIRCVLIRKSCFVLRRYCKMWNGCRKKLALSRVRACVHVSRAFWHVLLVRSASLLGLR